ncbi:hypothetical protein SLEP1_g53419 [Rubroshorea leprosula]|uniref:Uncharacterized protein n=1 Tax=Rubroshorea leprosula TaxID=152421 RepID=A0AAV5M9B4_9ROSI|nr:hypothetical protein SLEP1_g53419 [Rubroshorea leprosula]
MTNNLFSLRYDFMPSFKSESDHEEYWSKGSNYVVGLQDDNNGTIRDIADDGEEDVGDNLRQSAEDRRQVTNSTYEEKGQRQIQVEQSRKSKILEFTPSKCDSMAGGSVEDNGIVNCNRILKEHTNQKTTVDLWNFAKRIGVVAEDEKAIIWDLEEMETIDRKETESEGSKRESRDKKVSAADP